MTHGRHRISSIVGGDRVVWWACVLVIVWVAVMVVRLKLDIVHRMEVLSSLVGISPRRCSPTSLTTGWVVGLIPSTTTRVTVDKTLIMLGSNSPIVHVGIIVTNAKGEPFLLHTTRGKGTHVVRFETWVHKTREHYRILGRPLQGPTIPTNISNRVVETLCGTRYSYRFWVAVAQSWTWWPAFLKLPNIVSHTSAFCSETVAHALVEMGALDFHGHYTGSVMAPVNVLPFDFWPSTASPSGASPSRVLPFTPDFVNGFGEVLEIM